MQQTVKFKLALVLGILLVLVSGCSDPGGNKASIFVKVTNSQGTPLAKAEVTVEDQATKTTNDYGIAKFKDLKQNEYTVTANKDGYGPTTRQLTATKKDEVITMELTSSSEVTITDPDEYIAINDTTVKFLSQTETGNQLKLYLGTSKDNLQEEVSKVNQTNEGLRVSNLEAGTTYYYQLKATNGQQTEKTEVLSFTKQGNTNNWSRPDWAKQAIFYEVFVRSFYDGNGDDIGDFAGLKEKIPYFKELGVDALWLMPINDSPSYHGYDVQDYYQTDPDYGSRQEFREFLQAAHKNGLKVIMDLVVNHSSTQYPWFQKAKTMDSKYTDYYIWRDKFTSIDEQGPWGQQVWHQVNTSEYYYAIFWDQMPDLNYRNPEVRQKMKEVAKFWLDPNGDGDFSDGVDGFRLDAAMHIDDKRPVVTHNWWQEFNTAVKEVNPNAFLVGENWTQDTEKMAKFYNDLDASFNFTIAKALVGMAKNYSIDILTEIKELHQIYSQQSEEYIDATFLRNHDQNRIAYDLVGNRKKMKLAASLLFTMPGTPFIYYGEEIGQRGAKPDDNIREPFDWYQDAQGPGMTTMKKGGFDHSMRYTKPNDGISLAEQRAKKDSLFKHYKKLIAIRKNNPLLFTGNYTKRSTPEPIYGYRVSSPDTEYNLFVAHNISDQKTTIQISGGAEGLLTDRSYEKGTPITLNPHGTVILKTTVDKLAIK